MVQKKIGSVFYVDLKKNLGWNYGSNCTNVDVLGVCSDLDCSKEKEKNESIKVGEDQRLMIDRSKAFRDKTYYLLIKTQNTNESYILQFTV